MFSLLPILALACGEKSSDTATESPEETTDTASDTDSDTASDTGSETIVEDADGDGFSADEDCNDQDPAIFPYDRSAYGEGVGCGWIAETRLNFTCGLSSGGMLSCWSESTDIANSIIQDVPQGSDFVQLSVGASHACARDTQNTVSCWGYDMYSQTQVPNESFVQVSAGGYQSCGLREDQTIACWGGYNTGETPEVEGAFTHVSSGGYHNCGVTIGGELQCWAPNDITMPPVGDASNYTQVMAGSMELNCALDTEGTMTCWGDDAANIDTLTNISSINNSSSNIVCVDKIDGTAICVGDSLTMPPYLYDLPSDLAMHHLSATLSHACGTQADGTLICWGDNTAFPPMPEQ